MEKDGALEFKRQALLAIENLTGAVIIAQKQCNHCDFEKIKKNLGLAISKVDDALVVIYSTHPDLDDLV